MGMARESLLILFGPWEEFDRIRMIARGCFWDEIVDGLRRLLMMLTVSLLRLPGILHH